MTILGIKGTLCRQLIQKTDFFFLTADLPEINGMHHPGLFIASSLAGTMSSASRRIFMQKQKLICHVRSKNSI
jgi:hypothetical protein